MAKEYRNQESQGVEKTNANQERPGKANQVRFNSHKPRTKETEEEKEQVSKCKANTRIKTTEALGQKKKVINKRINLAIHRTKKCNT